MSKALAVRNEKLLKLRGLLDQAKPRLEEVLPAHMDVDRLVRTSVYVASTNPDLLNCTEVSFLNACMKAAQLGLEPTGEYGGGHFVRFGDQCTFVPDYRGVLDVVRRSGKVDTVKTYVIYENDDFDVDYMATPPVQHRPIILGAQGRPVAYYAIAWMKGSNIPAFEIMRRDEVDAHRKKLRSGNSDAWRSHFDRMALKTVLLRLCNLLPRSIEMMLVSETSAQSDMEEVTPVLSVVPENATIVVEGPDTTKSDAILAEIAENNGRLPKMDELRAMAEEMGVDISEYGRQRTAIWEFLQAQKEEKGADPEKSEAEGVDISEPATEERIDGVHGAISTLTDMQTDVVAQKCGEAGISMDSAKWTESDCDTVYGFVKEALGGI